MRHVVREIGGHLSHAELRLLIIQIILGLKIHLLNVSVIREACWIHVVAISLFVSDDLSSLLVINEHGWNALRSGL